MKVLNLLPLAALGAAFVIPDQEVMSSVAIEDTRSAFESATDYWDDFEDSVAELAAKTKHEFSSAAKSASNKATEYGKSFEAAFDYQSWLSCAHDAVQDFHLPEALSGDDEDPDKPNPDKMTIYQRIAQAPDTRTFAKLIEPYDDLIQILNSTDANYTLFVPNDRAFEKIPEDAPKPDEEFLKKVLTYHIAPGYYPVSRILVTRTLPSLLEAPNLGEPQRLSTQLSLRGVTVDFYSRVTYPNIPVINGVIHAVGSILVPPPKVIDILKFLPGEFSTLDLALYKTGLADQLNDTSAHTGGTFFAPSNLAFQRLGPKINAFLFSDKGEKYLKALLYYHLVPDITLYSDAYYKGSEQEEEEYDIQSGHRIPKGRYHVDLPTALEDKSLSVDIARFGRLIEIRINGYNRVAVPDGVASDGVIHVISSVLIPPKKVGEFAEQEADLTVEDFMERFEPYVQDASETPLSWDL